MTAQICDKKLDRYYSIVKGILFVMPFLCLGYLSLGMGGGPQSFLAGNPAVAVVFLSAMIQPYIGWLLMLVQRKLADGRVQYAVLNLAVLFLSECMMMSTVGIVGLGLLLWKTCRAGGCPVTGAWRDAEKRALFAEVGGSVLVALLAGLCLFATLRVGVMP